MRDSHAAPRTHLPVRGINISDMPNIDSPQPSVNNARSGDGEKNSPTPYPIDATPEMTSDATTTRIETTSDQIIANNVNTSETIIASAVIQMGKVRKIIKILSSRFSLFIRSEPRRDWL